MAEHNLDIGLVQEWAAALTPKRQSVFDRSIGVDEHCFSPRKIVRFLQGGVTGEDLPHLLGCLTCLENVSRLSTVTLESRPGVVAEALSEAIGLQPQDKDILPAKAQEVPPLLPAIIGLKSHIFDVAKPTATDLRLTCVLLPAFDRTLLGKINPESLRVDGAIIATRGTITKRSDINDDGKTDFLWISFQDGRLARRVRNGIMHHQRVIDTIRLHGRFEDDKRCKGFVGQARLEFLESGVGMAVGPQG